MESRAPAVVAVVVTTGSGPGLEAAVASLAAQNYEELSLLVVANGEAEHVPARVAAAAPNAFVRQLEENRGFGAACNEAALMVEGSAFFLFCHDDVRLEPDALQLMVETAFRANAGVVTPKVVNYDDPLVLTHVGQTCDRFGVVHERVELGEIDHGQQDLERDVFVAPGGCTLVRSDLFATLRGYDPLITVLGEDLDLCWRAQVAGARIVVAPLAKVAHRETIASGERPVSAIGTRRASRQDLQRRHQLLVVATGWGRRHTVTTLSLLLLLDVMEFALALLGRDRDRAGAILGSWRWVLRHRSHIRERRRQRRAIQVLSDAELARLQVGGASRLKRFFLILLREGLDRARGILPEPVSHEATDDATIDAVGFAAAFAEEEEFDEIPENPMLELRRRPTRFLTTFRSQAAAVVLVLVWWMIGSRNLVVTHLPLVGRLAPLDSWWSTWRHFFASWSPNGVGGAAPGMPGYSVIGLAGTFVFGRMGILARVALIFCVPLGALGISRLLRAKVSNRARVVASFSYLALPLGLNMISQGRLDVLVVVAGLPFVVRRLFELMDVSGFRRRPYGEPVAFGHRGWRTSEAGQRMIAVMLVALLTAMAPATIVDATIVVLGVFVARIFEPDIDNRFTGPGRFLGALWFNVAILLLPLTIDVIVAGRRALGVLGLARGPWSSPSFAQLLRGADGGFGASWSGWLLPLVAALALCLCRGERRQIATKVATIATMAVVLASVVSRHWLGDFAPDIDVLLALYMAMVAVLVGLGISALENDLRHAGFGWRQVFAGLTVGALVVAVAPFATSFASGRFDLPTTSVAESLSALAPTTAGGFRVLWLGDPSVVPVPGWSVAPGLEAATSMNGLPGGSSIFAPPGPATSSVLLDAVQMALEGRTVRLGQLLAPAGISTVVVMNSSAPELSGVQTVPLRPVPGALLTALGRQSDLSLVLETRSVEVYSNSLFHGIVSMSTPTSPSFTPVFTSTSNEGVLASGATVVAGLAPASAFTLSVNGQATARTTNATWTPFYQLSTYASAPSGQLTLHRAPLNGLVALVTLLMWLLMWLGFGWVHRLEWLFTGRRRHAKSPRHAKEVVSSARRAPLYVLIVAALVATGVASSLAKSSNPSALPNGLAVSNLAESTALYCTGLTSASGGLEGRVTLLNTTDSIRDVTLNVVSDTAKSWTGSVHLAAHATTSIQPGSVVTGNSFGVAAQISGGGVVGEEVTLNRGAQAPCISTGVTDWYAAGFDTTVGSSSVLSIFNPTATPAVFNVSTFSSAGFIAPARFQGISVGPHAQIEVKLGAQIVSSTNVGVRVRVLRGSLDIVGSQVSGSRASLSDGSTGPLTTFLFPSVTTAQSALAQLRIANPGPVPSKVTINVKLTSYTIAPLSVTIGAFSSAEATITPNSAIPAAGYAAISVTSSEPVVASLATGSDAGLSLSPPDVAGSEFMVADFAGVGFDAANITNTSSRPVNVTFTTTSIGGSSGSTTTASLAANATVDVRTLASIGSLHNVWVLVQAARPVIELAMTLPTTPKGTVVVAPLDGR